MWSINSTLSRPLFDDGLAIGMIISARVSGPLDLESELQFSAVGSPRIHDLGDELRSLIDQAMPGEIDERFSPSEIARIEAFAARAKEEIRDQFEPDEEAAEAVDRELDILVAKSRIESKSQWKRSFISAAICIAVELGFGASITAALFSLFKKIIADLIERRLLPKP